MDRNVLRVNAICVQQRQDCPLFAFGVEGRLLSSFARANQLSVSDEGEVYGYQRPEVQAHIRQIFCYLNTEEAILPNAVVLAFDERVSFEFLQGIRSEWGAFGVLSIPLPTSDDHRKCALIIDGQQRIQALAQLPPERAFPVLAVGFLAPSIDVQRQQFVLVNSSKPLPRDLLHRLVPEVTGVLPRRLENSRIPTKIVNRVCYRRHSPFFKRVRGIAHEGDIAYASLLDVAKSSLRQGGAFHEIACSEISGYADVDRMAEAFISFFQVVQRTWPSAWTMAPERSRLTHGVGIVAMGRVMDRIAPTVDLLGSMAQFQVEARLRVLKDVCAWSSGTWPKLGIAWNQLQNTSADKKQLSDFLLSHY